MKTNIEALIVVDYQNDFADKEWALYVNGGEKVSDYINSIMKQTRDKNNLVITSQDWHPDNHISFASRFNLNPFEMKDGEVKWPDHCVANTWGSDFYKEFNKELVTNKVYKWYDKNIDSYSSFGWKEFINWNFSKSLEEILNENKIKVVNIVWLATEYCDFYTVKDAIEKWFEVKLHKSWIAWVNVNPQDWENAIKKMIEMWAKLI